MRPEQQLEKIKRGTVEIIQEQELLEKLRKKKSLVVKAGFDPTAPDIHLGHTVLLRKLRHFQECGHKVIFLIGDATALVGDPSGQTVTRKTMTWEEVQENAKTYEKQVGKVLETDPTVFERRHNSEWFARLMKQTSPFAFEQFVELASKYTIARILERDDFQKRLKANQPISYLETFYPLMQGYDSVMLKSDVELGGTDQKFNLLVGRELQRGYKQNPQVVVTTPLLEGLDGVQKMSKSLGNHIGINESPKDMFGKVMSISDEMMWKYYELLTDEDLNSVKKLHPREAKRKLATLLVTQYQGKTKAEGAAEAFERSVGKGERKDCPRHPIASFIDSSGQTYYLPAFLVASGLVSSRSEARRKIDEGAVKLNGKPVTSYQIPIEEVKAGAIFSLSWRAVEASETSG